MSKSYPVPGPRQPAPSSPPNKNREIWPVPTPAVAPGSAPRENVEKPTPGLDR